MEPEEVGHGGGLEESGLPIPDGARVYVWEGTPVHLADPGHTAANS